MTSALISGSNRNQVAIQTQLVNVSNPNVAVVMAMTATQLYAPTLGAVPTGTFTKLNNAVVCSLSSVLGNPTGATLPLVLPAPPLGFAAKNIPTVVNVSVKNGGALVPGTLKIWSDKIQIVPVFDGVGLLTTTGTQGFTGAVSTCGLPESISFSYTSA